MSLDRGVSDTSSARHHTGRFVAKVFTKKTTGGSVEHKLYVNLFSQKVIDNKKQLDAKNNILKTGKRLTVRLRLDPANPVDPSAICPDLILRFLYNSTNLLNIHNYIKYK